MEINSNISNLIKQEKYTEALGLLKSEIDKGQDNAAVRASMAHCYYRLGSFNESADELTTAIAMTPEQGQLYSDRGISFFMLGNRSASLMDFNKAQELEPQNPYRYSSRAYVKDAFGDTKGAIADYQKALELDPEDAISYNNLGLLLEKIGYQKEAQKHFARADEIEGRGSTTITAPAETTAEGSQAPRNEERQQNVQSLPKQKQPLSANYFGSTLRRVLTTREGFQEFLQFWLGKKPGR